VKTQLVELLYDLYGRFDDLCVQMSCEKTATLGDCYYCVSGCPQSKKIMQKFLIKIFLAFISISIYFLFNIYETTNSKFDFLFNNKNISFYIPSKIMSTSPDLNTS